MPDLMIRDVDVVDGTGAARYRADVLIDKGRIAEITSPRTVPDANKTLEPGPGCVLAPGFIDMHAHSDLRLLTDPGHFPKISQGVTTEVIGQDGISYAPIDDTALDLIRRQIAGWNGNPIDLDFSWRSVAGYLARLDQGITPNAAYLVPQGTLRLLTVGADQRPATPTEIGHMQEMLAQGCDITLDTYPYLPGATTLSALLPSWAMSGGPDAALDRLGDPDTRARITQDVNVNGSDGCHGVTVEWETIQISGVANNDLDEYVGRTIDTIAADRGLAPVEVFFDLLQRDMLATTILQHVGHEENVRAIMVHPRHMGGSDAILVGERPHPRAWGPFRVTSGTMSARSAC